MVETITSAQARTAAFLAEAPEMVRPVFKDKILKLAMELIKYGDYIKTVLILDRPVDATKPARPARKIDPKELEGASDEERAIVERTPPPQISGAVG